MAVVLCLNRSARVPYCTVKYCTALTPALLLRPPALAPHHPVAYQRAAGHTCHRPYVQVYDANKKFSSTVDPVRPEGSSETTPAPAPEEDDGDDGDDTKWDDQFYNSVDDEVRDTFQYQAGGRFVGFGTNKAGLADDLVDDNPYGEN